MIDDLFYLPYVPRGAWLEERLVRCGKICRCLQGHEHGTYWRLCWREKGGLRRQRYVANEHVPQYQQALEERRRHVSRRRRGLRSVREAIARARGVLRAVRDRQKADAQRKRTLKE
jgi:hypothetical protein